MLVVIIVWQPVQIQMASFFKEGQVRDESLIFIAFSIEEFSFEKDERLITFLREIRLSSKWSCLWHVLLLTSRICERNKITDHSLLKYELLDDKTFTFSTTSRFAPIWKRIGFILRIRTGFCSSQMLLFLLLLRATKDANHANWCDKQVGNWPINDSTCPK